MSQPTLVVRQVDLEGAGPLRPEGQAGRPSRLLDPDDGSTVVLSARRVVAHVSPASGLLSVAVDGEPPSASSLPDRTASPARAPDAVEAEVDRIYRVWYDEDEPFEEVFIAPLGQPFLVRRWKTANDAGCECIGLASEPPSPTELRLLERWTPVDRSWHRELGDAAHLVGPPEVCARWDVACATLLAAVRTGKGREGVRHGIDGGDSPQTGIVWLGLGLCAIGRADLASAVVGRVGDLKARLHLQRWVRRWLGSPGEHPDEESALVPPWLAPPASLPEHAGHFCAGLISSKLGIRPDSRFGRVRFGPSEASDGLTSAPGIGGLALGQGRSSPRVTFHWSAKRTDSDHVEYSLTADLEAGSVPLQLVFEPQLRGSAVGEVLLDGRVVEAQVEVQPSDLVRVRLQVPLDQPRSLTVRVEQQKKGVR